MTKPFTQQEAREHCPHAEDCSYAQIPACTIASIFKRCSIYRDAYAERVREVVESTDSPNPGPALADKFNAFKGVNK